MARADSGGACGAPGRVGFSSGHLSLSDEGSATDVHGGGTAGIDMASEWQSFSVEHPTKLPPPTPPPVAGVSAFGVHAGLVSMGRECGNSCSLDYAALLALRVWRTERRSRRLDWAWAMAT